MPKLWTETIEEHRSAVREAVLDTAAELVAEQGLRGVTMSRLAERTGIGRATLYKYFPDADAVLLAWHERQVEAHLEELAALHRPGQSADVTLRAVLQRYALIQHSRRAHTPGDAAAGLHRGAHVAEAQTQLHELLSGLIEAAAGAGDVRDDIAAGELAGFCLHALTAATELESLAALIRLVELTLTALRPTKTRTDRAHR